MPIQNTQPSSLEQPFNHAAVIEAPLFESFPEAWQGTYYYDPARGSTPNDEANAVFTLIRPELEGTSLRGLQTFSNRVLGAVTNGVAQVIPFTVGARAYAYVMTEAPHIDKAARLTDFFGQQAQAAPKTLLSRLFDEFAARHEMGHDIELFEPGARKTRTRLESEALGDSFSLLGLFANYGGAHAHALCWFSSLLEGARGHHAAPEYRTAPALAATLGFIAEKGLDTVVGLDARALYETARTLASNAVGKRGEAQACGTLHLSGS